MMSNIKRRKITVILSGHHSETDAADVALRARIAKSKYLYLESHGSKAMQNYARQMMKELKEGRIKAEEHAADKFEEEILKGVRFMKQEE